MQDDGVGALFSTRTGDRGARRAVMRLRQALDPCCTFEIASIACAKERATVEWVLRGTNSNPLKPSIDPTGKVTTLRGVEILEGADPSQGCLKRVQRYFDQKSLYEQVGMQVIVEPISQGKAFYGYSKRVPSGNPAVPAVLGTTWIRFRDQSELDHIRTHSAKIIQDFLDEPGFISIVTGAAGDLPLPSLPGRTKRPCTVRSIKPIRVLNTTSARVISRRACGRLYGSRITSTASGHGARRATSRTT